jgi:hypothetical protein
MTAGSRRPARPRRPDQPRRPWQQKNLPRPGERWCPSRHPQQRRTSPPGRRAGGCGCERWPAHHPAGASASPSATSGRMTSAWATPSRPSVASPTTSMPTSSSNPRSTRRMPVLSSTSSTRGARAAWSECDCESMPGADPLAGQPVSAADGPRWLESASCPATSRKPARPSTSPRTAGSGQRSAEAGLGAAMSAVAGNVVLPMCWTFIVASGTSVTCLTTGTRHANQVTRPPGQSSQLCIAHSWRGILLLLGP